MTFLEFARLHGVDINPARLYASDKIKRCPTIDKPRSDNGAYFWDGRRGWVMDWSGEARVIWFDGDQTPWTAEEKAEWAAKKRMGESVQQQAYARAASTAETILRTCKLCDHPYLSYKGLAEEKGLVKDEALLVPMRNVITRKIQGYQSIFWDPKERKYQKKMFPGMRAKNAVLSLGSHSALETWFVEGYSTGLSLKNALNTCGIDARVVVTFSAGNLVNVADQVKGQKYIFADNDQSETGQKAAQQTGLPWTMADHIGWDANDLHVNAGLFAVVKKVMDLRLTCPEMA
jgi:putative DNA primase/helicase